MRGDFEVTVADLSAPVTSKRIRWDSQADLFIALAGIVAITVGTIGIVDGIDLTCIKNNTTGPLHGDWFKDNTGPLILYGIGTAIAWTCSLRAIFRIATLEAAPLLSQGIQQRDLSDMFEMKLPTKRWLYFRLRMWGTFVFAILCALLYGGAALTYRLAFTSREGWEVNSRQNTAGFALLGCSYWIQGQDTIYGRLAMLDYLLSPVNGGHSIFAPSSPNASTSNPDWDVQSGWYSPNPYSYILPNSHGWWEGPVLVGLTQPVTSGISTNKTVHVAEHPHCGPLLQSCNEAGTSCYWLSLAGGVFNISFTTSPYGSIQNPSYPKYSISGGSWKVTETENGCPMQLSPSIYEQVVQDVAGDQDMTAYYPVIGEYGDSFVYQKNQTLHALLASRINKNNSEIMNTTPLVNLGLLKDPDEKCSDEGKMKIKGEFWQKFSVSFFPKYQFTSSGLLVVWGLMLLFASWPFRRMLIAGTLTQWMALGADLGSYNMQGASSGHASANNRSLWALTTTRDGNDLRSIKFEEVEGNEEPTKVGKICLGKLYI